MSENITKKIFLASRDKRSRYVFSQFKDKYEIVGTYDEQITRSDRIKMFLGAVKYFYPDYRKYRQISIASPFGVDYRAKKSEKAIRQVKNKIDFIFQYGASYPPLYTKPADIPYFVFTDSCCDPDDKTFPWRWRAPRVARDYTKKQYEVFTGAYKVFTRSQWAKDLIIKVHNLDEHKIINVGSGPIFDPIEERVDFSKKENIVLFVGGDFERKGVDVLRKSLDMVEKEVSNIQYLIIGKNTDKMKFNPHPAFKLLGPIYDRKVLSEYYSKAKVFVLASRFEPLGHVLWEAMSFSTPVIVAQAGGMPETVQEGFNGFTFPVEDHKSLAESIISIMKDDKLSEELCYNARTHFEKQGRWQHVFSRIVKVLDDC